MEPAVGRTMPSPAAGTSTAAAPPNGKRGREEPSAGGEKAGGGGESGADKATAPPPAVRAKRSKNACGAGPLDVSKRPAAGGAPGERAEAGAAAVGNAEAVDDPVLCAGLESASLLAQHGLQREAIVAGAHGTAVAEPRAERAAVGEQPKAGGERPEAVPLPAADFAARQEEAVAERRLAVEAAVAVARQQALALRQAAVAAAAGRQYAATERQTQQPSPPPAQHRTSFGDGASQQTPPISTGMGARLPAASVSAANAIAHASAQPLAPMTPSRAVSPRSVPAAVPMSRDTSWVGEAGQGGDVVHQPWARPSIANAAAAATHAHAHPGSMAYRQTQARAAASGGLAFPPGSAGTAKSAGMVAGFQRASQRAWIPCSVPATSTAQFQTPAPTPQQVAGAPGTPFVPVTDSYQAQMRAALAESMWRGYWADGASSQPASQTAGRVADAAGDARGFGGIETQRQQGPNAGRAVPGMVSPRASAAFWRYPSSRNAVPPHPGVVGRWPPPERSVAAAAPAPSAAIASTATMLSSPRPATSPRPMLLGKRKTPSPDAAALTRAPSPATVSPPWSDRPIPAGDAAAAAQPEGVSDGPSLEGRWAQLGRAAPPAQQLGNAASPAAPAPLQSHLANAGPAQGAAGVPQTRERELEKQREQERARVARREELRRSVMSAEHLHIQFRSLGGPDAGNRGNDEWSSLFLLGECFSDAYFTWHIFCIQMNLFSALALKSVHGWPEKTRVLYWGWPGERNTSLLRCRHSRSLQMVAATTCGTCVCCGMVVDGKGTFRTHPANARSTTCL